MTRKEYLESLGKPAEKDHDSGRSITQIVTVGEYIACRRKCQEFEEHRNISENLTAEDYALFDKNFEKALGDVLYKDESFTEDQVDNALKMMEATDWKWASINRTPTKDEFIKHIRYCYEHAFDGGRVKGGYSTGGVTVDIDLLDHMVIIQFGSIDCYAYDGDDQD